MRTVSPFCRPRGSVRSLVVAEQVARLVERVSSLAPKVRSNGASPMSTELSRAFLEQTTSTWSVLDSARARRRVARRLRWRKRRVVAQNLAALALLVVAPVAFAQIRERRAEPVTATEPMRPPIRKQAFTARRLVAALRASSIAAPMFVAAEVRAESLDAMFARADAARRDRNAAVAIEVLERARVLHATDPRAFLVSFTLGKLYADVGDELEAATAFRRVHTRWHRARWRRQQERANARCAEPFSSPRVSLNHAAVALARRRRTLVRPSRALAGAPSRGARLARAVVAPAEDRRDRAHQQRRRCDGGRAPHACFGVADDAARRRGGRQSAARVPGPNRCLCTDRRWRDQSRRWRHVADHRRGGEA